MDTFSHRLVTDISGVHSYYLLNYEWFVQRTLPQQLEDSNELVGRWKQQGNLPILHSDIVEICCLCYLVFFF
jgi:hypothetical protein